MIPTINDGLVGIVTGSKSESFRRLNAHLLQPSAPWPKKQLDRAVTGKEPPAKRIRQNSGPILNALETRFLAQLTTEFPGETIYAQAIRLELARGLWYKPDFFLPACEQRCALAFEVKGPHAFRGGCENLKTAARVHQWVKFFLVWEDENRMWQRQEVLA